MCVCVNTCAAPDLCDTCVCCVAYCVLRVALQRLACWNHVIRGAAADDVVGPPAHGAVHGQDAAHGTHGIRPAPVCGQRRQQRAQPHRVCAAVTAGRGGDCPSTLPHSSRWLGDAPRRWHAPWRWHAPRRPPRLQVYVCVVFRLRCGFGAVRLRPLQSHVHLRDLQLRQPPLPGAPQARVGAVLRYVIVELDVWQRGAC